MNYKALTLALVIVAGTVWAQTEQPPASSAGGPARTPVTYKPAVPEAPANTTPNQPTVYIPATTSNADLPRPETTVLGPSMPSFVDQPTGPSTVSEPSIRPDNYGPTPPDSGRLVTTPSSFNGPATPLSSTFPQTPSGNAPQPPTCDKVCY